LTLFGQKARFFMCDKKILFILLILFPLTPLFSQRTIIMSLDEAISAFAEEFLTSNPNNRSIAVIVLKTDKRKLTDYFIDKMIEKIWESGRNNNVKVFERKDIEPLQQELNFSLSGNISDETAQRIGHFVGASTVIYGSFERGSINRISIKAAVTETGEILLPKSYDLLIDRRLSSLLEDDILSTNPLSINPIGTAALNLAFGMGSFIIQKDTKGGAIIATLEGLGIGAIIVSRFLVVKTQELDLWTDYWYIKRDTSRSTPVLLIGLATYAAGAIYGAFRPFNVPKYSNNLAETYYFPLNIDLVFDQHRNATLNLSYTMRF